MLASNLVFVIKSRKMGFRCYRFTVKIIVRSEPVTLSGSRRARANEQYKDRVAVSYPARKIRDFAGLVFLGQCGGKSTVIMPRGFSFLYSPGSHPVVYRLLLL